MTDHDRITVRKVRLGFPDDLDDVFPGDDLSNECSRVALSLTLPHLEPYLIRTYRSVAHRITDPALAQEVEAFCGQEAQHHRNHARINRIIKSRLGATTAARLDAIEDELEADYRRFSADRSDRFNTVYAEAFEAMTCAMALTALSHPPATDQYGAWQQLWAWHLAEEIEHRTVAFDVYHHLGGGHLHRVVTGLACQAHYLRHLDRLHRVLMHHHGRRSPLPHLPPMLRRGWRRYVRTLLPGYDPTDIEPPATVIRTLSRFDAATSSA